LFVRVHNATQLPLDVDVELLYAPADANGWKPANWTNLVPNAVAPTTVSPANPNYARVHLDPAGFQLARFKLTPADPVVASPTSHGAYLLIALIHSSAAGDTHPDRTVITSIETFWSFLRAMAGARKVALRAVRYTA